MNRIMDPAQRGEPCSRAHPPRGARRSSRRAEAPAVAARRARSPKVRADIPIPAAPYLDRKVRDVPHLAEVWSYINPFMLYGRHLGYKGNFEKELAEREREGAGAVPPGGGGEAARPPRFMKVRAVWQFFEAERDGNAIHLFAPGGASAARTPSASAGRRARTASA